MGFNAFMYTQAQVQYSHKHIHTQFVGVFWPLCVYVCVYVCVCMGVCMCVCVCACGLQQCPMGQGRLWNKLVRWVVMIHELCLVLPYHMKLYNVSIHLSIDLGSIWGQVAERLGSQVINQKVAGSISGRAK